MKKRLVLGLLIIFSIVASMAIFTSCGEEEILVRNDDIEATYGDSYEIISTLSTPNTASEFLNQSRVKVKITIDPRVSGLHTTKLYAPLGETVSVTIDSNQIGKGHELCLNKNLDDASSIAFTEVLEKEVTNITRLSSGSLIEFNISSSATQTFTITVSGAIIGSYYRYGMEDESAIKSVGSYTVLDATNVKVYFPISENERVDSAKQTMFWWRNAVTMMDKVLEQSFYAGDKSAMNIYFKANVSQPDYNVGDNSVFMPLEYLDAAINYEEIISGNSGKLYAILELIANLKCDYTIKFNNSILKTDLSKILATLTYVNMVDGCLAISDNNIDKQTKAGYCIEEAINGSYENLATSLFLNIYYGYGEDSIMSILNACVDSDSYADVLSQATDILQVDFTDLAAAYGIDGYDISGKEGLTKYYLVGSSISGGLHKFEEQTGIHAKLGEKTKLDLKNSIIGEGWTLKNIESSHKELWSIDNDGVYYYSPSSEILRDSVTLVLVNGDKQVRLVGNITVDVAVCNMKVYEKVNFDSVESAISNYKKMDATKIKSLELASVQPLVDVDESTKSFSVTNGSIEVPQDGYYRLYLRSTGLVSVVFGVKDYSTTIFKNQLTVPNYTSELSYRVKLQKGYTYYFTIYDLANTGVGYACLGIQYEDGAIEDIGTDYLAFPEMERKDIQYFETPRKSIDAIYYQEETIIRTEVESVTLNAEDYILGTSQKVEAESHGKLVFAFKGGMEINYISLTVSGMAGVKARIMYNSLQFGDVITLVDGVNIIQDDTIMTSGITVVFEHEGEYDICLTDYDIGFKLNKMTIIPASSSEIEYIGEWKTENKYVALNGSLFVSKSDGSAASFAFNGKEVAVYATKGPEFGNATVYIDGKEVKTIDFYNLTVSCSELVFHTDLSDGDHTIMIKASGESPINIDYITVAKMGETKTKNDFSKLWYMAFLPGIVFIAGIVFISLDIKEKRQKRLEREKSVLGN